MLYRLQDEINMIDTHIFVGDFRACHSETLQKYNIKRLICVDDSNASVIARTQSHADIDDKIKRLEIFIDDSKHENIKKHFSTTTKFISDGVINNENVLIHCHAGRSRSVTLVMGYLISKYPNKSIDELLEFVQKKRHTANPNDGFIIQLYQHKLQCMSCVDE